MGAFVLGVLVGWLAEWLFYTFWVKAGDNGDDCSAIKAELDLKNRQISSLQSQLASIAETTNDTSSASAKAASASSVTTSASNKSAVASKSSAKTSTTSTKASTKSSGKVATKGATKAKTAPAKSTASKTATKKAATKKATSTKRKSSTSGDDFTKLTGIGPSMSATLKTLGIDTFEKLASTEDDKLRDMLEKSGARMNNNKEDMDSWNEQATLAAKGDFAGLKTMQAALKK